MNCANHTDEYLISESFSLLRMAQDYASFMNSEWGRFDLKNRLIWQEMPECVEKDYWECISIIKRARGMKED